MDFSTDNTSSVMDTEPTPPVHLLNTISEDVDAKQNTLIKTENDISPEDTHGQQKAPTNMENVWNPGTVNTQAHSKPAGHKPKTNPCTLIKALLNSKTAISRQKRSPATLIETLLNSKTCEKPSATTVIEALLNSKTQIAQQWNSKSTNNTDTEREAQTSNIQFQNHFTGLGAQPKLSMEKRIEHTGTHANIGIEGQSTQLDTEPFEGFTNTDTETMMHTSVQNNHNSVPERTKQKPQSKTKAGSQTASSVGAEEKPWPYKCSFCSKAFQRSCDFISHERTHTGDKPYKCAVCAKAFSQCGDYHRHMRSHKEDNPFKCCVCSKEFSRSDHLERHMRIHTGDKPYTCSVCSKGFSQASSLKSHMRTHTGDKPYSCSVCSKNFSHSSGLQTHMKIHTGDRPHECAVCLKTFMRLCDLNIHMNCHTGEKTYRCSICSKVYSYSGSLAKHMKSHQIV